MPKESRYLGLKKHLENCGLDEITMTFEQIADIVGGMPQSAYDYTAPWYDAHGGPLSQCWINAGYTASGVVRGKQVTFTKQSLSPDITKKQVNMPNRTVKPTLYRENQTLRNLSVFDDKELLIASLDKTAKEYRLYDPGWYLYRMIINFDGEKISTEFVELVYVTLCAWNMNSRGAKLSEYNDFEKSIFSYGDILQQLGSCEIHGLCENHDIQYLLRKLFLNLNLVAAGKPVLVTVSKALHFFLPHLIVPIDRKYTLNFYNGNVNVNPNIESQFRLFLRIQQEGSAFSSTQNLAKFKDDRWNLTIPKVIDNMIIGFMKL